MRLSFTTNLSVLKKKNNVGGVIASPDPYRVRYLQDEYTDGFMRISSPSCRRRTSQVEVSF